MNWAAAMVEAAAADSGEAMVAREGEMEVGGAMEAMEAREGEMEVGGVCQWVFAPTGSSIRSIHQWFLR